MTRFSPIQTLVGLLLIAGLTRFRHADLDDLIDRSSRHVAALRRHRADRIESAPPRRAFPRHWRLNLQAPLTGLIV
jgi:hypothetical protein